MGHLIHSDDFIINLIAGKVVDKLERGRPGISYLDQIKSNLSDTLYKLVKEKALHRTQ